MIHLRQVVTQNIQNKTYMKNMYNNVENFLLSFIIMSVTPLIVEITDNMSTDNMNSQHNNIGALIKKNLLTQKEKDEKMNAKFQNLCDVFRQRVELKANEWEVIMSNKNQFYYKWEELGLEDLKQDIKEFEGGFCEYTEKNFQLSCNQNFLWPYREDKETTETATSRQPKRVCLLIILLTILVGVISTSILFSEH